jgi:3-oxoadipate enol-lactonase
VNAAGLASISWHDFGQPDAPAVILSGALATDFRLWGAQAESLQKRFRVIVYNHRGHGGTVSGERTDWSISTMADDVVALMNTLGLEQVAFVGLSLGGSIGLELALTHPHRISRLACCGARADAPAAYKALWRSRIEKVSVGGMASIAEETLSRWFAEGPTSQPAPVQALASDMLAATSPAGYIGCAHALSELNLLDRLKTMDVATHYLSGTKDSAIASEVVQQMHERTPGSRFSMLHGAGHLANLDCPGAFNVWLSHWLDNLA